MFGLISGVYGDIIMPIATVCQPVENSLPIDCYTTAPVIIPAAALEHPLRRVTILLRSFCKIIAEMYSTYSSRRRTDSQTHMKEQPSDYHAYLVRIWRDGSDGEWRTSTESVATGLIVNFACLSTLFAFLDARTKKHQPKQNDAAVQPPPRTCPIDRSTQK